MENMTLEELQKEQAAGKKKMIFGIVFVAVAMFFEMLGLILMGVSLVAGVVFVVLSLPCFGVGIPFVITGIIKMAKATKFINQVKGGASASPVAEPKAAPAQEAPKASPAQEAPKTEASMGAPATEASASAGNSTASADGTVLEIDTALAQLKVYEEYCILTSKKNAVSLLITNKYFAGEKKFYYSDLTSIQFREPGKITDGYLEFEYPGSRSGNSSGAYSSENAIAFTHCHLEKMKEIYTYIDGKIHESKKKGNVVTQALSPAEELKKFKDLLDMGVITQEEFDEKKKQLLGV